MAQILDTAGYKALRGITDASRDAQIAAALPPAESAIISHIERDILVNPVTETRRYRYEGPIVNIDDTSLINAVTIDGTELVADEGYVAERQGADQPYSWLDLGFYMGRSASPEMGFTRNLDLLPARSFRFVEVDADWGWASIPESFKLAVAMFVDETAGAAAQHRGISAQAVADTSVVYEAPENSNSPPVLPPAVEEILNPYRRIVL